CCCRAGSWRCGGRTRWTSGSSPRSGRRSAAAGRPRSSACGPRPGRWPRRPCGPRTPGWPTPGCCTACSRWPRSTSPAGSPTTTPRGRCRWPPCTRHWPSPAGSAAAPAAPAPPPRWPPTRHRCRRPRRG
ncbi:MAG: hypothetical protein AVDCRST_MAG41-4418, partial [uncultured Corynebacteriales bacterium]